MLRRYWPGRKPEWAKEDEEDEDEEEYEEEGAQEAEEAQPEPEAAEPAARTGITVPVIVKRADDPRLARLAAAAPARRGERHREVAEPQASAVRRLAARVIGAVIGLCCLAWHAGSLRTGRAKAAPLCQAGCGLGIALAAVQAGGEGAPRSWELSAARLVW